MARSENLSVLPQVVSSFLRLADDPHVSQRELEAVFEKDPAIMAKILKVANSAYYGGTNVPTIGRAITFLGVGPIKAILVSLAFQQASATKMNSKRFAKVEFWRHCLATAVACRILAKMKCPARSEEMYCAGMMHDIGYLVLDRFMPEDLDDALALSFRQALPVHIAEKQVMGFDHAMIGGLLAKHWGLSPVLRSILEHHHNPKDDKKFFELTELMAGAHGLVCEAGFTHNGQKTDRASLEALEKLNLPPEQVAVILQVITNEIEKTCADLMVAA